MAISKAEGSMLSYREWVVLTARVFHMRDLRLAGYERKAMKLPGLSSESTACMTAYYMLQGRTTSGRGNKKETVYC